MEVQIENAIVAAFDPRSSAELKSQAFDFFNQLRTNPEGWPSCLKLALRRPHAQEVVRLGCLEVVTNAVSVSLVDEQGLDYIKGALMEYIRAAYADGQPQSQWESYAIENKLVQLLTQLFVRMYKVTWQTFIEDMLSLCSAGKDREAGHHRGVRLYLRTLGSIHDEIGDTLVSRTQDMQRQANDLKDLIRERDVNRISQSWMEILPSWRNTGRDIFNECLLVIGKWASWIDLSLIINEAFLAVIVTSILEAASTEAAEEAAPAVTAMLEIMAKKMKAEDKLRLYEIFRIQDIIAEVSATSRLQDKNSSDYDTDLAELVAKVVNAALLELVIVMDGKGLAPETLAQAQQRIKDLLPYLVRYFADDFDEICSTVIPSLTDFLAYVRKRTDQSQEWIPILPNILQAIITKMRYDDTSDWGSDNSGTEEAEFQDLRKRLEVLQQTIAAIDERTYVDTIRAVVIGSFDAYASQPGQIDWRSLDLALHEMFIFGLVAQKNGALYNKNKPVTVAAEALIEMLVKMVDCDVAQYNHPAIQLQYMELCVRYATFFDNNPVYIPPALENFAKLIHHTHVRVKQRSWYLFFRFIKLLRPHIGSVARNIVQSIGPLLTIKAEVAREDGAEDDTSSANGHYADTQFASQLYLYEAVGSIAFSPGVSIADQLLFVKAVTEPQFGDLEQHLPLAKANDERSISQVHHIISALGTLAHGFIDSTPSHVRKSPPVAPEVSLEFIKVAEAILVALDGLNSHIQVRDAARTAFARLLGVLGTNILPQLPQWFSGLLVSTSSKDEIAAFLRLLGQVIFALSADVRSFINALFTPLLERVFKGISEPTSGTDEEIQLVELKTHYLSFLQVLLNQGLESVLVSSENQGIFETMIASIEHFTKDSEDLLTAKLAFQVLNKMCEVWGGPDLSTSPNSSTGPVLPGFDRFMLEKFSGLIWALPGDSAFDPSDARARQVLMEAGSLHKQIFSRVGGTYLDWLRETELKNLGMTPASIDTYSSNLAAMDIKSFRQFFVKFTQSMRA